MEIVTTKVSEFGAFAVLVLTDEESLETFMIPAELDPILSKQSFEKVCFVYVLASALSTGAHESALNDRISQKHCKGIPCTNYAIVRENDAASYRSLCFVLGLIIG